MIILCAAGFVQARDAALPLFFVPNAGLTDASFRYLVQAPRFTAGFAQGSVVFRLPGGQIELSFPGSNSHADVAASGTAQARANFLIGSTSDQWRTDLATSNELRYRELYPGIELAYFGSGAELKSEFRVAPGADATRIALHYSRAVAIDANGDLLAGEGETQLREKAPDVYQETHQQGVGGRIKIAARYRLLDPNTATFELGAYDPSLPLVIDPVVSYATYLGGSNTGAVTATAVDASGNLYVGGWTSAVDFPTHTPFQASNKGNVDAFIAKLNSTGTQLLYATYIGGNGADQVAGIAVDAAGEAYATGFTASTNFPLASPIRSTLGGSRAAFVLKLNSAGTGLMFSTYLCGTAYDMGTAITVDTAGDAWVVGDTQSANFPMTTNAIQTTWGGGTDIFIAELTSTGALTLSTYWGGSGAEHAGGVALDPSGNVYVAGGTTSTDFPLVNPLQHANAGGQDAFVFKMNSAVTFIYYSTYLGGSGTMAGELANAIAADASGNAYVAGVTNSANFPVKAGSLQVAYGGAQDAFVTKINAAGSAVVYSTFLGGTSFDWATDITLDTAGDAFVTGYTSSFDFPVVGATQAAFAGGYDAFVTELNTTGGVLVFSTYYGGTGIDEANAISVDPSGNIFVGGQTNSTNLPLVAPLQSANNGGATGWVARLGVTAAPPQRPSVISVTPTVGSGANATFTATYADTGGAAALGTVGFLVNATAGTSFACYVTYTVATQTLTLAGDTTTSTSLNTIPGGASVQNDQCILTGNGSSVVISGNTLTLTLALHFQNSFAGAKTVYLSAADAGAATGFVAAGTWTATIPPPQPQVISVSPSSATGFNQTFIFTFGDTTSANNLADVAVLFSTSSTIYANQCYIVVDLIQNTIALEWDNMLGANSKPINSPATLQNSHCSIGANSLVLSGQTLSITMAMSFTASFAGSKGIFMEAAEIGANTGWSQQGTYNVVAAGIPQVNGVVPNSGAGTGQRFTFNMSDVGGAANLVAMGMLFSSSPSAFDNACYLVWDSSRGTIALRWDVSSLGATPITPGVSGTASNNQCTISGLASTVTSSGTSVTVTVDLTFKSSWNGTKNMYVLAAEPSTTSGWVQVGTWTVTSGTPVANSMSPNAGAGHFPFFTFTATDSSNQANITNGLMLFNTGTSSSTANACYVFMDRTTGTVNLYNDAGTSFTGKPFAASSPLSNSQCAIGYASIGLAGNSVQFLVQILFTTGPFSGPKNVYFEANEATSSTGWVSIGTWTTQ